MPADLGSAGPAGGGGGPAGLKGGGGPPPFALALGGGPHSPSSEDDSRSESPEREGLEGGPLPPVVEAGSSVGLDPSVGRPPLLRVRVRAVVVVDALAFVLGVRLADMLSLEQAYKMIDSGTLLDDDAVSRHWSRPCCYFVSSHMMTENETDCRDETPRMSGRAGGRATARTGRRHQQADLVASAQGCVCR